MWKWNTCGSDQRRIAMVIPLVNMRAGVEQR
jgi:hypothetical protein